MKKLLLSMITLMAGFAVNAQLNNVDFENWTNIGYDSLHNWTSTNDMIEQQGGGGLVPTFVPASVFEETSTFSSGATSVRMSTEDCPFCASVPGAPTEVPGFITQSEAYTDRPESISFEYQFNPANNDVAAAAVILTNSVTGDTIASTIIPIENAAGTWTNMTAPLSYFSPDNPDSITVVFTSSADFLFGDVLPNIPPAQVGTEFWVDDLGFIMPTAGQASPVGLIFAEDVADNANGLDLQYQFAAGQDESTINEYRVMAVKEANAAAFDLTAAQASTEYDVVNTTGAPIQGTFTATSNDVDGDPIQNGVPYRVFVMSEAGGSATIDNLSMMSNSATLNAQEADAAQTVLAADVNDNGDGTDLDIQFNPAADENTVSEYRIMIVKAANAGSFDVTAAEAVPAADYTVHTPDGNIYQSTQTASTTDVDGDVVVEQQPYHVFVLSMADGTMTSLNALSDPSNEVTLSNSSSVEELSNTSWSAYPNPVVETLNVDWNGDNAQFSILDMSGRTIQTKNTNASISFNVADLKSGVYLIRLESASKTEVRKFMKR